METQIYLGDGLYYEHDGYQIRLFTQEGNEVFLDAGVLSSFFNAVKRTHGLEIKVSSAETVRSHGP